VLEDAWRFQTISGWHKRNTWTLRWNFGWILGHWLDSCWIRIFYREPMGVHHPSRATPERPGEGPRQSLHGCPRSKWWPKKWEAPGEFTNIVLEWETLQKLKYVFFKLRPSKCKSVWKKATCTFRSWIGTDSLLIQLVSFTKSSQRLDLLWSVRQEPRLPTSCITSKCLHNHSCRVAAQQLGGYSHCFFCHESQQTQHLCEALADQTHDSA